MIVKHIRDTLPLKGDCKHSYERGPTMSKPIIDTDACIGCGACADTCPVGVIEVDDVATAANEDDCIGCGACADACPVGAIEIED